eukprot:TRINITY_DN9302_c0_g1_i11.p2 TRINITY_DN9302_c0_g1~~TRINITY_DN9302_c0_g1_i11.p2  ORF type:complete len:429 (+),score=50.26 TRINITY_DN9302_c0_g1_i11:99-1385(+)
MVSIRDSKGVHLCGGSLIAAEWILTAAHCLHSMLNAVRDEAKFDPIIYVGLYSLLEEDYETHSIKTHIIYPEFDVRNADGDVALLQLSHESKFAPVQLAKNEDLLFEGVDLMVMGWGRTEQGSRADVLQNVKMEFVGEEECNRLWEGAVLDSMFCAGGGQFDACDGDSGGPIIFHGSDSNKDIQIGIVSWGRSMACGVEGRPGVYTNIGYPGIRDWINETITPDISWLNPVLQAMNDPTAMSRMNGLTTVEIGTPLPDLRKRQCVKTELGEDCSDPPGFDVSEIEGYTIHPNQDLGDLYNYKCTNSLWQDGCLVDGSAEELAKICNDDKQCSGFVHLPQGYGSRSVPTGFLKSGQINSSLMLPSNWTAVYIKQEEIRVPSENTPIREYLHIQQRDLPDSYNYWCPSTEGNRKVVVFDLWISNILCRAL